MLTKIEAAAQIPKSLEFIAHLEATLAAETEAFNERCALLNENIAQHQFLLTVLAGINSEGD
jgi:hypothetical protein